MRVPLCIFLDITQFSDIETRKQCSLVNSTVGHVVHSLLLRRIKFDESDDILSFREYLMDSENDSKLRIQILYCLFLQMANTSHVLTIASARIRQLMNNIRHISVRPFLDSGTCRCHRLESPSTSTVLAAVPAYDSKRRPFFARLKSATILKWVFLGRFINPTCPLRLPLSVTHPSLTLPPCFLSNITQLNFEDVYSTKDNGVSPIFKLLGANKLDSLEISFRASAFPPNALAPCLRAQRRLKHITFPLQDHFEPWCFKPDAFSYAEQLWYLLCGFAKMVSYYRDLEDITLCIGAHQKDLQEYMSEFIEWQYASEENLAWIQSKLRWRVAPANIREGEGGISIGSIQ